MQFGISERDDSVYLNVFAYELESVCAYLGVFVFIYIYKDSNE